MWFYKGTQKEKGQKGTTGEPRRYERCGGLSYWGSIAIHSLWALEKAFPGSRTGLYAFRLRLMGFEKLLGKAL